MLQAGDLVIAIRIPPEAAARRSHYVKVRDRTSFAWALASCAVSLRQARTGRWKNCALRWAVSPRSPGDWRKWRMRCVGRRLEPGVIEAAAALAADGAMPRPGNAFKVPLLKHTVARALGDLGGFA